MFVQASRKIYKAKLHVTQVQQSSRFWVAQKLKHNLWCLFQDFVETCETRTRLPVVDENILNEIVCWTKEKFVQQRPNHNKSPIKELGITDLKAFIELAFYSAIFEI